MSGDADPENPEDPEDPGAMDAAKMDAAKMDAAKKMDAKIKDAAKSRAKLIDRAMPFLKKIADFDIYSASTRSILEKSLKACGIKDEAMKSKSDDYLKGILDSVSEDRHKSAKFFDTKLIDSSAPGALSGPMSALEARKKLK